MHILLVEDNLSIVKGLEYAFLKKNYTFTYKTNYKSAYDYILNNKIDLIILDVTLPDGSGFDLFEKIDVDIPTIFLTAMDDEEMVVKGLNMGAYDYITKPFSTIELLARVDRILLRFKKNNIIKVDDISFDMDKMCVFKNDKKIELSSLEIKLLHLLFLNINKVVNRSIIIDKIWEWTGNDIDDHTVTVYFKRIREKIDSPIIKTVKGIGYLIEK